MVASKWPTPRSLHYGSYEFAVQRADSKNYYLAERNRAQALRWYWNNPVRNGHAYVVMVVKHRFAKK